MNLSNEIYWCSTSGGDRDFFAKSEDGFWPNYRWIFAEDFDATYAELLERGANIVQALEDKPWQLRQFAMEDLKGHIFNYYHDL